MGQGAQRPPGGQVTRPVPGWAGMCVVGVNVPVLAGTGPRGQAWEACCRYRCNYGIIIVVTRGLLPQPRPCLLRRAHGHLLLGTPWRASCERDGGSRRKPSAWQLSG